MDNLPLERFFQLVGELYLSSRIRNLDLEKSLSQLSISVEQLSAEKNQLLAEIGNLKTLSANNYVPK
jgi:hypothetical protein